MYSPSGKATHNWSFCRTGIPPAWPDYLSKFSCTWIRDPIHQKAPSSLKTCHFEEMTVYFVLWTPHTLFAGSENVYYLPFWSFTCITGDSFPLPFSACIQCQNLPTISVLSFPPTALGQQALAVVSTSCPVIACCRKKANILQKTAPIRHGIK